MLCRKMFRRKKKKSGFRKKRPGTHQGTPKKPTDHPKHTKIDFSNRVGSYGAGYIRLRMQRTVGKRGPEGRPRSRVSICRSKPKSPMTPTIRPGPLRRNSRSVASCSRPRGQSRFQQARRAFRANAARLATRRRDVNIYHIIHRERLSKRVSRQTISALWARPSSQSLHAVF